MSQLGSQKSGCASQSTGADTCPGDANGTSSGALQCNKRELLILAGKIILAEPCLASAEHFLHS